LSQLVKPQSIAGKVVLIGYVGQDSGDTFRSLGGVDQVPGVMIHAQMTSNILSHILDRRSLITTWGDLGELSWITLWGGIGGVIWFRFKGWQIWILSAGAVVVLVASYGVYFNTRSVWIPLVPAGMALIITPLVAVGSNRWRLRTSASN
jgi:CHASE2 domain-containing sensor protein